MMDEEERAGAAANLESSAALLRSDSADLDAMLHALAERLSGIPGLSTVVTHRDGKLRQVVGDVPFLNHLRRRSDPIRSIVVTVGPCAYWVRADKGSLQCGTDRLSQNGGKAADSLVFSQWADALLVDITRQNQTKHEAITALRDLIELDRS